MSKGLIVGLLIMFFPVFLLALFFPFYGLFVIIFFSNALLAFFKIAFLLDSPFFLFLVGVVDIIVFLVVCAVSWGFVGVYYELANSLESEK